MVNVNDKIIKISSARSGQRVFKGVDILTRKKYKFLSCHIKPVDREKLMDMVAEKGLGVEGTLGMTLKDSQFQTPQIADIMNFLGI